MFLRVLKFLYLKKTIWSESISPFEFQVYDSYRVKWIYSKDPGQEIDTLRNAAVPECWWLNGAAHQTPDETNLLEKQTTDI